MAKQISYDVEAREVTMEEVRDLWPLLNTSDLVGAVFSPERANEGL